MTAAAKEADINGEVGQPDFAGALQTMFQDLRKSESDKSKAGKLSTEAWKKIKDEYNLSAPAARWFFAHILEREDETRDNNLRTLYGLLTAAKIGISADLVDKMGDGEAPTMPVAEKSSKPSLATIDGGKED